MPVAIAEYFGQRTDVQFPSINIHISGNCPFMNAPCSKIQANNKPVCIVKKIDKNTKSDLWIVCKHRLCSTSKNISLTTYQTERLLEVAQCVFGSKVKKDDILIKREVPLPVVGNSSYSADYVMMLHNNSINYTGSKQFVLEMQGGGETSNTGKITEHIQKWENTNKKNNHLLSLAISGVGTIETNAWRRQQEQFIIKGNISQQTGGGIVFCVGSLLYDYLWQRISNSNLRDLRSHNWTLAIIGFTEDQNATPQPGPIPIKIDQSKILFTNYNSFIQTLTNQGGPHPEMFLGNFEKLSGGIVTI